MKQFFTQPQLVAFLSVWLAIFLFCSILSGIAYSVENNPTPTQPATTTTAPLDTDSPSTTTPAPSHPETEEPTTPTVDYYKDLIYSSGNSKYLIYLDAGHGWSDPGVPVYVNENGEYDEENGECITEKDINLAITKKLKKALETMGYEVAETRISDDVNDCPVTLKDGIFNVQRRVNYINSKGADYCISIHCNSLDDSSVSGTRIYHYPNKTASQKLGSQVIRTLLEKTDAKVTQHTNNFAITRDGTMPAILIEAGFMTNINDLRNLCDPAWQDQFACAIAMGLDAYIHAEN